MQGEDDVAIARSLSRLAEVGDLCVDISCWQGSFCRGQAALHWDGLASRAGREQHIACVQIPMPNVQTVQVQQSLAYMQRDHPDVLLADATIVELHMMV